MPFVIIVLFIIFMTKLNRDATETYPERKRRHRRNLVMIAIFIGVCAWFGYAGI